MVSKGGTTPELKNCAALPVSSSGSGVEKTSGFVN